MLGKFKIWKTNKRPILDLRTEEEDNDEPLLVSPPRFIKISDGKICLAPSSPNDNTKEKEVMEDRIAELEEALVRLQQKVNDSQCGSPTLEKDLKDQLENMNRAMKTKDRKTMQAFRDHKTLQARFTRQEAILQIMQQENKTLQQRVRQYEHCLDDVMRKVVDAIVAEDNLRLEVAMLKSRVRDLEAQNAALSTSPAKGKDEGYCTMSSGQPQPSNGHLEDLPEEPEQWLLPAEPCSIEMEDWSMSQEEGDEVNIINEHEHDWIWNSGEILASSMIESQSEGITQLLQDTIVYSEDEEITCKNFTKDFYKLVNIIPSGSTRSLYSHVEATTDDEDEDDDESSLESKKLTNSIAGPSPTPSEAGLALVTSCSSSESDEHQNRLTENSITVCINEQHQEPSDIMKKILRQDIESSIGGLKSTSDLGKQPTPPALWKKSSGWMRVPPTSLKKVEPSKLPTPAAPSRIPAAKQQLSPLRKSRIPPPVPIRRSYAS